MFPKLFFVFLVLREANYKHPRVLLCVWTQVWRQTDTAIKTTAVVSSQITRKCDWSCVTKPIVHKELEIHALGGRHDTAGHRQGQRQHAEGLPKESREDSCVRRSLLMEARRHYAQFCTSGPSLLALRRGADERVVPVWGCEARVLLPSSPA